MSSDPRCVKQREEERLTECNSVNIKKGKKRGSLSVTVLISRKGRREEGTGRERERHGYRESDTQDPTTEVQSE